MSPSRSAIATDHHVVLGVHITDRTRHASAVQRVLLRFGRMIQVRVGLHNPHGDADAPNGLILLQVAGRPPDIAVLKRALESSAGVEVRSMVFRH